MAVRSTTMPDAAQALPGRSTPMAVPERHFVNGERLSPPFPAGLELAMFGMGCFWGAERRFWEAAGRLFDRGRLRRRLHSQSDLRGGLQRHDRAQGGGTGCVRPDNASATRHCCAIFWESHDPTQGMRQGDDVGTQYRSAIFAVGDAQLQAARESKLAYQRALAAAGLGRSITTEVLPAPVFFYAEDYHQQYLAKNPDGYCGMGGVGVACPAGLGVPEAAGA